MDKFGSDMNPFWRDVFVVYDLFKQDFKIEDDDTWQIPIFLSSRFMIGRKPFWHSSLFTAGCRTLSDFYNNQGHIISFEEFRREYPCLLNALTFVALRRLVQRICNASKSGFVKPIGPFIHPALLKILNAKCKQYYDALISIRYKKSEGILPSQKKWNNIFNEDIPWDTIHNRYAGCSKDTSLIWFQDKITHRILTTNTFVSKFMDVSDLCTFCGQERETIYHLMSSCVDVITLWETVRDVIRQRLYLTVALTPLEIILGIDYETYKCTKQDVRALQRLLLLVKRYIYRCKVRKERPCEVNLLCYLKCHTDAEFRCISEKNGRRISQREINRKLCCGDL